MRGAAAWRASLFAAVGGLLLATHLSPVVLPVRSPVISTTLNGGWIGTQQPTKRAYFRHTVEISFVPRQAWIAIAADDYTLYVNGVPV